MTQDEMKKAAAIKALDYIKADTIVGVGTGSTVNHFIDALATIKDKIIGAVSSSESSTERLKSHGIEVFDLNNVDGIDVYVDGADEINPHLHMIKGGGAALTREKIITDNGNVIIDVHNLTIMDPKALENSINAIAGVVTNGLFANRPANVLIIGSADGAKIIK